MKVHLLQIQDFLQSYIRAVSVLLNVGLTVVDQNLIRIAGTAHYAEEIGKQIQHGPFYLHLIQTGQPGAVRNTEHAFHCQQCVRQEYCTELADIAYPIFYNNEVLGIIGIIAFSKEEKDALVKNGDNFEVFLKHMSSFIESKLVSIEQQKMLENQLDEAISMSRKQIHEMGFVGQSQLIKEILELSHRVALSSSTILITGESGTGKDVLAKLIHDASDRSNKLMVSINCGAIPENLIESELFGYEAGSFTGASKQGQIGKFELAHGSTLFLDEIGEMSMQAQTRLLRVLQEKEITKIGGKKGVPIDVRVICATNQDLMKLVEEKKFRMDLYYRINVIPIELPPLRERRGDINLFIQKFVDRYNKRLKKNVVLTNPEVIEAMVAYDWPGNVRELKNLIEYLVNIKDSDEVMLSDLPSHVLLLQKGDVHKEYHLKTLLAEQEKHILETLLTGVIDADDKRVIADRLGISLATLYRKMSQYEIVL